MMNAQYLNDSLREIVGAFERLHEKAELMYCELDALGVKFGKLVNVLNTVTMAREASRDDVAVPEDPPEAKTDVPEPPRESNGGCLAGKHWDDSVGEWVEGKPAAVGPNGEIELDIF
jgi:hypothetical protein